MKIMANYRESILYGLFSGIISYVSTFYIFGPIGFYFTAGLVFGINIAIYYIRYCRLDYWFIRVPLWIAASTGSYFVAVNLTLNGPRFPSLNIIATSPYIPQPTPLAFMLGGFVGTLLMLIAFVLLLKKITPLFFAILTILGTILSLSWFLLYQLSIQSSGITYSSLGLYIVWQIGMTIGLGQVIKDGRD